MFVKLGPFTRANWFTSLKLNQPQRGSWLPLPVHGAPMKATSRSSTDFCEDVAGMYTMDRSLCSSVVDVEREISEAATVWLAVVSE